MLPLKNRPAQSYESESASDDDDYVPDEGPIKKENSVLHNQRETKKKRGWNAIVKDDDDDDNTSDKDNDDEKIHKDYVNKNDNNHVDVEAHNKYQQLDQCEQNHHSHLQNHHFTEINRDILDSKQEGTTMNNTRHVIHQSIHQPATLASKIFHPRPVQHDNKNNIDDLWAVLNKKIPTKNAKAKKNNHDKRLDSWLNSTSVRSSQEKKRTAGNSASIDVQLQQEPSESNKKEISQVSMKGNLDAILAQIQPKKGTVLEKTKQDWSIFKQNSGEEVQGELEAYKKDKNRFTEKVAFLERADVRQWEYDQEQKKKRKL